MKQTTRYGIAGLLSLAVCAGCAHTPTSDRGAGARKPATAHEGGQIEASPLNDMDTVLFGDLFHADTHGKRMKWTMKTRFWTDMDSGHLRDGASDAFQKAIIKTLSDDSDPSIGFAKRLQSNLVEQILKEFVMTLKVYKIISKTLQFDVYFVPSFDSPETLVPEFSNNGLVQLEQTGRLTGDLKRLDDWKLTSALSAFAKESRAVAPADESGYRRIGSVLTVNIKILDMDWDISRPIPKTKQNAVKGFVRVRRYFAGPAGSDKPGSCEKGFTLKSAQIRGESNEHWTTVDAIYSFNLASFLPKADRIEIFPGRLMSPNQGSGDLLPNKSDFVGKTLKSGKMELKFAEKGQSEFTVTAKKLAFSFSGILNSNASDFDISPVLDPAEGTWVAPQPNTSAMQSCGNEIRENLRWHRFFTSWSNRTPATSGEAL